VTPFAPGVTSKQKGPHAQAAPSFFSLCRLRSFLPFVSDMSHLPG
jgi:hypothetical protein